MIINYKLLFDIENCPLFPSRSFDKLSQVTLLLSFIFFLLLLFLFFNLHIF